MGDFVIKTGDMLQVTMTPPAIVPQLVAPIVLVGTGTTVQVGGVAICLQGDELPPAYASPMPYMSPPFVTPGVGTLSIILAPNNLSIKTVQGKAILLKGATFQASFSVSSPAMQPTPAGPVPDPVLTKPGTCMFQTTNISVQAG